MSMLTQEYLDALKEAATEATQGNWTWGLLDIPLNEMGEHIQKCVDMSPGEEFFLLGNEDDSLTIAHFGNGPTSKANSKFVCMARPEVTLDMLETIRCQQIVLSHIERLESDLILLAAKWRSDYAEVAEFEGGEYHCHPHLGRRHADELDAALRGWSEPADPHNN